MNKIIVFTCDSASQRLPQNDIELILGFISNAGIKVGYGHTLVGGVNKSSFICTVETEMQLNLIYRVAADYKQTSILEIDPESKITILKKLDGKTDRFLGVWSEINGKVGGDYTFDWNDGKFYKCLMGA